MERHNAAGYRFRSRHVLNNLRYSRSRPYNYEVSSYNSDNITDDYNRTSLQLSITGWYIVVVSKIQGDWEEILQLILDRPCVKDIKFNIYRKQYQNNVLKFLIEDLNAANAIKSTDQKITLKNNQLSCVSVYSYLPSSDVFAKTLVSNEIRELMGKIITLSYDSRTKTLDLSNFHNNSMFTDNQLFVPLNQPAFLLVALNMAAEYFQNDLLSMILKNNHIYLSDGIVWLRRLFPGLQLLDLTGNKLASIYVLKSLTGYNIKELRLTGNPLCLAYKYTKNIKRCIKDFFPSLKILDDIQLITVEADDSLVSNWRIPINMGNSYLVTHDSNSKLSPVKQNVDEFVKTFFKRYDLKTARQFLHDIYDENSTFSITSCSLSKCSEVYDYLCGNRDHGPPSGKDIYKGKKQVQKRFLSLPPTKHDFGSFFVDVPIANDSIIQICINGVFIDHYSQYSKDPMFRSFCRVFGILPMDGDWTIVNDSLFVTTASQEMALESEKRFLALGKQPTVDVQEPSTNTYFDERNRTESRFAKFMRASQENNFSASATPSTNQSYLTTFSSALSSALKSVTRVSPTPTMISPTTESTFTTTDTVASTDAFVFTDNFAVSSTDTYTLSSTDPYVFTESNSNSSDDTYGFSDTPDSFYSLASHL